MGKDVLYSVKGQHRYKGNIISKPNREKILNEKYKHIEMGVIGEPIIGSSNRINPHKQKNQRRELKVTSLDTRLPRINDLSSHNNSEMASNTNTERNLKLPQLTNKNRVMGIYGPGNKLKQSLKYRYQPGLKYRYGHSKDKTNKSYAKLETTKSVHKLKTYKNGIKSEKGTEA